MKVHVFSWHSNKNYYENSGAIISLIRLPLQQMSQAQPIFTAAFQPFEVLCYPKKYTAEMNFHLCDLIVTLNIIPDIFHFNNINGTKSKEHRPSLVFHCNSRERDVPTQFC